jgi:hypothetical protein
VDCQAIKMAAQFYSDRSNTDYIRFQSQTVEVCTERVKYSKRANVPAAQIAVTLKTYHSVCENLLLSLRSEECFAQAKDCLLKVHKLIKSFELEHEAAEIEWLVVNWCKIKRDMWKSKKYDYTLEDKKTTFVDHCGVSAELVFQYLLEELKYYSVIK